MNTTLNNEHIKHPLCVGGSNWLPQFDFFFLDVYLFRYMNLNESQIFAGICTHLTHSNMQIQNKKTFNKKITFISLDYNHT